MKGYQQHVRKHDHKSRLNAKSVNSSPRSLSSCSSWFILFWNAQELKMFHVEHNRGNEVKERILFQVPRRQFHNHPNSSLET